MHDSRCVRWFPSKLAQNIAAEHVAEQELDRHRQNGDDREDRVTVTRRPGVPGHAVSGDAFQQFADARKRFLERGKALSELRHLRFRSFRIRGRERNDFPRTCDIGLEIRIDLRQRALRFCIEVERILPSDRLLELIDVLAELPLRSGSPFRVTCSRRTQRHVHVAANGIVRHIGLHYILDDAHSPRVVVHCGIQRCRDVVGSERHGK
jgi:hypothetical protein